MYCINQDQLIVQLFEYTYSCVNGWKTLGMKYRPLYNRWTERMSGRPSPQHTEHTVGNFLWCGSNQHLPEKRVWENVVSSSSYQGLGRRPNRQQMFRNMQTILNILFHFCTTFWLIFLRTAIDLPSLPLKILLLQIYRNASLPHLLRLCSPEIYLVFYYGNTEYVVISQCYKRINHTVESDKHVIYSFTAKSAILSSRTDQTVSVALQT